MENHVPAAEHNDCVIVNLDRPYTLKFTNRALKEFSALTHVSMKDFDEALLDFEKQQAAAYILIKEDCRRQGLPIPTPQAVEDLLDEYLSPGRLFYLISKAAEMAFMDSDLQSEIDRRLETAQTENPPTAAGTGPTA